MDQPSPAHFQVVKNPDAFAVIGNTHCTTAVEKTGTVAVQSGAIAIERGLGPVCRNHKRVRERTGRNSGPVSVRFRTDGSIHRVLPLYDGLQPYREDTIARGICGGYPSTRTGFDNAVTTADRLQNNLLGSMADEDFAALAPSFTLVDIPKGEELALPETRIKFSWFPLSGIVSVVAATESGTQAEVGIVGREGMCSVATLHGVDFEMMQIFSQIPGRALRIPSATLRGHLAERPTLHAHLLGYAQSFMLQVASSALTYATQTIESRLARWLLMSLDRLETSDVTMTHEALALMLGVRPAGVTVAVQSLEAKGAVTSRRAAITVINHNILLEIAGNSYGTAERAYQRVLGIALKDAGARQAGTLPAGSRAAAE